MKIKKKFKLNLLVRIKSKHLFSKSIYSQEVKDERINNDEAKKVFKIDYSKLIYKSSDNQYFDFNKFGPLTIVLI